MPRVRFEAFELQPLKVLALLAGRAGQPVTREASFMPFVNVDARFDELRSNARFQAVVQRLGLG